MSEGKNWVYKFKMKYYGPEIGEDSVHKHSGLIIAKNAKEALDRIYEIYHEVYVDSLSDEDKEEDNFDFDFIRVESYGDIADGIIADEEDDYYGI